MKRICIFGDSITWGMGLPGRFGWSDLLRNELEKESDYFLELYSLGIDRNTSKDLLHRITAECEARKPDLIVIDIGTNDSLTYKQNGIEKPETEKEIFTENLQLIINKCRKYTDEIIFIGLAMGDDSQTNPLPRSTTGKCYTKIRIHSFSKAVSAVCAANNLAFIDIERVLCNSDFVDGVHPNKKGHKKIFNKFMDLRSSFFTERNTIVDEDDNVIGAKIRSEITKDDIYRVASLWLRNNKGQVLLAQRAFTKSHDPGKWGPAVAGTVAEGEDYLTNITRGNRRRNWTYWPEF